MDKAYELKLDEMKKRVWDRLCLYEQVQVASAKNHAQKNVDAIISSVGIQG